MALRHFEYRDPLQQLIEREEQTCKGCAFQIKVLGRETCSKQKQQHGRRCRHYIEKEGKSHVQCDRETGAAQDRGDE